MSGQSFMLFLEGEGERGGAPSNEEQLRRVMKRPLLRWSQSCPNHHIENLSSHPANDRIGIPINDYKILSTRPAV